MAKPWDETMKQLIDTNLQQILDWVAQGATFLRFEPTELAKPKEEEEPLRADHYFASLAYGPDNRAEQDWLRKVIQDMHDIIQQTPLYQFWTREALEEGLREGKQQGLEEGKQKGLEEGLKEGKQQGLEAMRQTLVNIVRARFPRLVSLAKTQVAGIEDLETLDALIVQVSTASKAKEARRFLLGEEEGE
jgi:flagellar biosynthesis/type III secretory pathway protein FliH